MRSISTSKQIWKTDEKIPTLGDRLLAVNRSVTTALVMLDRRRSLSECHEETLEGASIDESDLEREAIDQMRDAHEEMYWILRSFDVEQQAFGLLAPDDDQKEALEQKAAASERPAVGQR